MSIAFITGITGQDGSYLAEELLEEGWIVYGLMRRASVFTTERLEKAFDHPRLCLRHGDVTDISSIMGILEEIKRDNPVIIKLHIFALAAQSHVGVSFETPLYTAQVDAIGVLNMLEAIRHSGLSNIVRMVQASTSEMYGLIQETPQSETTPFHPRSPYGVAKVYGYWITKNYREAYGMFVCNAINFNHESERRGKTFVTRKITIGLGKIVKALREKTVLPVLALGNLDAKRDWGHAIDYIRGMKMMLEAKSADDYVLATGKTRSVREFAEAAFKYAGLTLLWRGKGLDEEGYLKDLRGEQTVIKIDSKYFRPAEVDLLLGDASKIYNALGWEPTILFDELVERMVKQDVLKAT